MTAMDRCVLKQDRYQHCWPRRKGMPRDGLLRPLVPTCISRERLRTPRRCLGQAAAELIETLL